MSRPDPESLLETLDVQLEAFAMCEIDAHCGLACRPTDSILVHFVLEGEGAIACEHGRYELRPGRIILIPRNLAKTIEGPGPIISVTDADQGCPLSAGLVRFRASASGVPGLVLGCGSIKVGTGGTPGLLDQLDRPLVEKCDRGPLPMMLSAMSSELRRPGPGTRGMVEALMKQILVYVLRRHLARPAGETPLYFMLRNPQIGRAVAAVVKHPEEPHSVESLAALAGMSRSSFNRQFTASYGSSPMEFVQTARLNAAARMLTGSSLPVKSIAAAVGYASRSHFSRAFTAQFGTDPSRFRERGEPLPSDVAATPAETAEAAEEAMAAELRNRTRNMLARVRSVARRTGRGSTSVSQFVRDFEARLNSMAQDHAAASGSSSGGCQLAALLADALRSQGAAPTAQIEGGPAVALEGKAGEVMALALHELAVNSRRFGHLSRGVIPRIAWTIESRAGADWLLLRWEEPGCACAPPVRQGFGTEIITRRVAYELGGNGTMECGADGFAASIELPLSRAAAKTSGRSDPRPPAAA